MKPREYQQRALSEYDALRAKGVRRICCVGPAGCGKSFILRSIAQREGVRGSVVLSHRTVLAEQLERTVGVRSVTIQAAVRMSEAERRMLGVGCVLVDEAHHLSEPVGSGDETELAWGKVAQLWPEAVFVGATASPMRADGAPLRRFFDAMVKIADYSELIAAGHLVPARVRVEARAREVAPGRRLKRHLRADLTECVLEHACDKQSIVFAPRLTDARRCAHELREHGVSAICIDGITHRSERDAAFAAFSRRELRVMTCYDVLTEGFDAPITECVVLARGCQDLVSYIQGPGRGSRPHPGKTEFLLLDLVGASLEFGSPTADRDYSLDGVPIVPSAREAVVCAACWRGFAPQHAPKDRNGAVDYTLLNRPDDPRAPVYGRFMVGADAIAGSQAAMQARLERSTSEFGIHASELAARAKTAELAHTRLVATQGTQRWLVRPGSEGVIPCPHCARDTVAERRGAQFEAAAKRAETKRAETRKARAEHEPTSVSAALVTVFQRLQSRGKSLAMAHQERELRGVTLSAIRAEWDRLRVVEPAWYRYQEAFLATKVQAGWKKGVFHYQLHRIFMP